MEYEIAIIGAGPAGYSASIYAGRAGITAITFDTTAGGGLANSTPNIENYAGFLSISGFDLMQKMQEQAKKYADIHVFEEVKSIQTKKDVFIITTVNDVYSCKAVVLATGTQYKKLGVPGENSLLGRGVSFCATCDGQFFKDKTVVVVGGGNSALVEAIFLKQVGCKNVTIIHRREQLRAEKAYEEEAVKKGVNIMYNTKVNQILGTEKVESIEIYDVVSDTKQVIAVDGVFVAVGEQPNNKLAKQLQVKLDDKGFVVVDRQQRTTVKGVYAAGDITGGLRQIITAASQGAVAALATTEVLGKQYPY